MTRLFCVLALALGPLACEKPADPAYLTAIADASTAICACVTVPEADRVTCMGKAQKAGTVNPTKTPNGEAPGIYEKSLDAASLTSIEAARSAAASCEAKIMATAPAS